MGAAGRWSAMASVARRTIASTPSASATTAMVSPGSACSRAEHNRSAGCAVAVLPTVLMRGSTRLSALAPMALRAVATARLLRPVTARRSMLAVPPTPLPARAACHASAAAGPKTWAPKRSSHVRERAPPGIRQRSVTSTVRDAPPRYSASTGPSESSPTSTAAAPSPAEASSAPAGRPSRASAATTRSGPRPASAACSAPIPERTAPPKSRADTSGSSRRAAWMAAALVFSR